MKKLGYRIDKRLLAVAVMVLAWVACSEESATTPADLGVIADSGGGGGQTVKVHKQFKCYKDAVKGTVAINDVEGLPGAAIAIKATDAPCQFDLLYQDKGKDEVLSNKPGGYLVTAGGVSTSGEAVVCATNVDHGPASGGAATTHGIRAARLECTIKRKAGWTALTSLVDGGADWAAWVQEITASGSTIKVTYVRDFSFQFANISDNGRPSTDGIYSITLQGSGSSLTASKPTKVSDKTVDPKDISQQPWEPTAAELKELSPWVKKDEGSCPPPNGCKLP